jgi:imidazolonepropionase-like amidohydrolase
MRLTKILSYVFIACSVGAQGDAQTRSVSLFEGARLITGVGGAYGEEIEVIENSAFIVDNGRFTRVGRKGEVKLPAGAIRVDLTGKTVMPALVEMHGHVGYRKGTTNFIENYTEENVVDHLQRLAYHGVGVILSLGVDPRELGYLLRDKFRVQPPPDAAMFLTGGQGLMWPNSGPGYPMRPAPYGIRTEVQARMAIREMAAKRVDYVKVWVDDRRNEPGIAGGPPMQKLPLPVAAAAIDEAARYGIRVMTHSYTLEDNKALVRAGLAGFAHPPWRERELDNEFIQLMKDHPKVFVLMTTWGSRNLIYGASPPWLSDPLLSETFSPADIEMLKRPETPKNAPAEWKKGVVPRSVAKLKSAGVRFGLGGDIGGISGGQFFGWSSHIELASMVEAGLTPAEAIIAATSNSAEFLGTPELGMVASGKSASFIVLDANPLDNINNTRRISRVYLKGVEVNRPALRAKWTGKGSTLP